VGLLSKDDSCVLLLLEECGGGKNPGASNVVLLRVGGGGDHGVKFLSKLGGLNRLAGVIGGHRRWCRDVQGGSAITGDAAEEERTTDP
jgi:hypothetical protein